MDFNLKNSVLAAVLIFLTVYLGYFTNQSDFYKIVGCYLPFFAIYAFILKKIEQQKAIYFFIGIGILLRFLLMFSYPNLSDDLYRFIWDGRLLLNGFNPFDHLPKYYIDHQIAIEGITPELYAQLNSPEYFTIYPPVAQLTFVMAVWLFPKSIWGSALVMKLFLFLFETGSIYLIVKLLKKFKLPFKNVLIYALNPLIIVEICGNLHFEGGMIFFLLLALWFATKIFKSTSKLPKSSKLSKFGILSAIAFALSIASKLLPLIFLPFFIKRLGWKKSFQYFSIIGVTLVFLFFPLINGVFIENFGNSLNLYFQKFEFNASIYYIARWIGYETIGWNMIAKIGPALAICTPICIFLMAGLERVGERPPAPKGERPPAPKGEQPPAPKEERPPAPKGEWWRLAVERLEGEESSLQIWRTLPTKILFAICIYLCFTTTVHPWYVALPLVLCCFTKYRFPLIWSGLVVLTYINYSYPTYHENLWIVSLEYGILGLFLIYELNLTYKFPQVHYLRPNN